MKPAPTLYADWQERRRRTNELAERDAPLRVLDYLLDRYRDDPLALKPARFPFHGELFFNRRALLVHCHLSCAPKVESNAEGRLEKGEKISRILHRIQHTAPQKSLSAPNSGASVTLPAWSLDVEVKRVGEATLPPLRRDNNDIYREQLISAEPHERVYAAVRLAETGTLDDVNLLLDLMALPLHERIPVQVEADQLSEEEFNRMEQWAFAENFWVLWSELKRREIIDRQKFIDERALLERCAHRLARRNHAA